MPSQEHSWPGTGWSIKIVTAPILKNSDNSTSEYSTGAWKRELNMTTVAGQSLPGATFGGNSIELIHMPSGLRISFCALEALRAWRLLDLKPIPHLAKNSEPTWDYSFTTPYAGTTRMIAAEPPLAALMPDGNSLHSRPAADLASGQATLRKPLCKCRGSAGREALISLEKPNLGKRSMGEGDVRAQQPLPRPPSASPVAPPPWVASNESINLEVLLTTLSSPPTLVETVELWKEDLEPHSFGFLRVRVLVADAFWVVRLRCFVRVNGVRARVLDTTYVCHRASSHRVLRQREWREGSWEALAGPNAPAHMKFDDVDERAAAAKLPLLHPPETQTLEIPPPAGRQDGQRPDICSIGSDRGSAAGLHMGYLWRRKDLRYCEALSAAGGIGIAVSEGGLRIEAIRLHAVTGQRLDESLCGGDTLWTREADAHLGGATIMSAALAPCATGTGGQSRLLLAVGTSRAQAHIWSASTGERLRTFAVGPLRTPELDVALSGRGAASVALWVELMAWSTDGRLVGVAAGRDVVMASAECGEVVGRTSLGSTAYALDFAQAAHRGGDGRARLAVAAYGEVDWLVEAKQHAAPVTEQAIADLSEATASASLHDGEVCDASTSRHDGAHEIGAAAVLSVAASPDGCQLAAGCLDKRLRVWPLRGNASAAAEGALSGRDAQPRDWVGFDGAVKLLRWSADSQWLAASGGGTLLLLPRALPNGEAPTLCAVHGGDACASEQPSISALAWCPRASFYGDRGTPTYLLAAIDAASGRTYLFDVTRSAATIPRRAGPVACLDPPSDVPRPPGSSLPLMVFDNPSSAEGVASGAQTRLLVSDGQAVGCACLRVGGEAKRALPDAAVTASASGPAAGSAAAPVISTPALAAAAAATATGGAHSLSLDLWAGSPDDDPTIAALVLCALGGYVHTAAGLCHLGATCAAARRCAESMPSYWAVLDLSTVAQPSAFFADGHARAPRFRGVVELSLQFCDSLTDAHLGMLPPSLRRLTLDACHRITDIGLKAAAASCGKRLELLSVYWSNHISSPGVLSLGLRCPSLTSLSLSGCKAVGSTGVLGLASRCRSITSLNLTRLPLVDDTALAAVVQANASGLRELRLYAAGQYGDGPIVSLGAHCAQLCTLDCTGLSKLTDAAVLALGRGCPLLRELLLSWVTKLTDVGVCALARGCRSLAVLSLHGIKGIGPASLEALAQHCAHTLVALDVRGCVQLGAESRTPELLVARLPRLVEFVLHTT